MKARDMMQSDVSTVSPEMSLAKGQRLMHDKAVRHLPVVSDQRLVGIVTDRDIRDASPSGATTLTRGEVNYQMDNTPIHTCMSRNVVTIGPDDASVQIARLLLEQKFGCVPVVAEKELIGIITDTDCLKGLVALSASQSEAPTQEARDQARVYAYMQTNVITVAPEQTVSSAYQHMQGTKVRHAPAVTEWNQLMGLVTDRDIRRAGASDNPNMSSYDLPYLLNKMTVKNIMTTAVRTVDRETTVTEAAQIILENRFGCLPVVRDGAILDGIITVTDLLRAYVEELYCEPM